MLLAGGLILTGSLYTLASSSGFEAGNGCMNVHAGGNQECMTKPQQPELRRSGLGSTDQDATELRASEEDAREEEGDRSRGRSVPPDNRPGHHPPEEQDKPPGPPSEGDDRDRT